MISSVVEFLLNSSNNVVANLLTAGIMGFLTFLAWRSVIRKRHIKKLLCDKTLFTERVNKKHFFKYMNQYTRPTFTSLCFRGKEQKTIVTFKDLWKYVIDKNDNNRVLVVCARAGMGKSRLLRFITYKLLSRAVKKHDVKLDDDDSLFVDDVYYTEFNKELSANNITISSG